MAKEKLRIGIVGAGFSGTMMAVNLLRCARWPVHISLFERRRGIGRGLAYSTQNPRHVLNVRVANMSAFEDDPSHFLRWLWRRDEPDSAGLAIPPSGHAFVSRAIYGRYLESVFKERRFATSALATIETIDADVIALRPSASGIELSVRGRKRVEVDRAVLCIGNFPPSLPFEPPPGLIHSVRFIGNPWNETAIRDVSREDEVVILGTGLTMIDVAIGLDAAGHKGRITALSRHGLLPLPHRLSRAYPRFIDDRDGQHSIRRLMRRARREVERAQARGHDWHDVLDALRPDIQMLWQGMPVAQRRRFLRHVRPYWDVHRHRLAPEAASRIDAMRASGRLQVLAGRVEAASLEGDRVRLDLRKRASQSPVPLIADRIINCFGPECDYTRIADPLVRQLLDDGIARPDPLRLGLEVTNRSFLVAADGRPSAILAAAGPPTRGAFWEITAVLDIRRQCGQLAQCLIGDDGSGSSRDAHFIARFANEHVYAVYYL